MEGYKAGAFSVTGKASPTIQSPPLQPQNAFPPSGTLHSLSRATFPLLPATPPSIPITPTYYDSHPLTSHAQGLGVLC